MLTSQLNVQPKQLFKTRGRQGIPICYQPHHLDAKTIADLYKERWQIEVFQVDQAEPASENIPGHFTQCSADSIMDHLDRLPPVCLSQIHGCPRLIHAADAAFTPVELV